MAQKKLEKGSQYEKYDLDGDGIVTDEEFEMDQKLIRLENEDKKEDANVKTEKESDSENITNINEYKAFNDIEKS